MRTVTLEILLAYFRTADIEEATGALWESVMIMPRQETAIAAAGDTGGVMLVASANDERWVETLHASCMANEFVDIRDSLIRVAVDMDRLLEFLDNINSEGLIGELFLRLLEHQSSESEDELHEHVECVLGIQRGILM